MSASLPIVEPSSGRPPTPRGTSLFSPLLPVVATLIGAAAVITVIFARLFPATHGAPPAVRFVDVASEAGISFHRQSGLDPDQPAPTTLGGGVVVIDYNHDSRPDLLFINGAPWPWEASLSKRAGGSWPALYRNDGNGHFTNVTSAAGLNVEIQGMTATVGDFDNDGYPDIFVTCVGQNHLFRNRGDGTFEDITESAGVGGEDNTWSTGAAWIDYDNDGRLDLVVCHYVRWPHDMELATAFGVAAMGRSYGTPTGFFGVSPSLYRNLGDGHFALVPGAAGLRILDSQTGQPRAKALTVLPVDANGDGKLDLIFSYQTGESILFINQGNGTFRRLAMTDTARREGFSAALASTRLEPFAEGSTSDQRFAAILAASSLERIDEEDTTLHLNAKGAVALLDYDNDGRIDLFATNARIESDVGRAGSVAEYIASPAIFWNSGQTWLPTPSVTLAGNPFPAITARGAAVADFNGDGDLEIALCTASAKPMLLRNAKPTKQPWLAIDLMASSGPRAADGARVEVHTPRHVWVQTMTPALGYMAQSQSTLHFGLGDDARVHKIVVIWPSGRRQEVRPEGINRRLVITEQ